MIVLHLVILWFLLWVWQGARSRKKSLSPARERLFHLIDLAEKYPDAIFLKSVTGKPVIVRRGSNLIKIKPIDTRLN